MNYNHLTLTECARIEVLRQENYSLGSIARKLKRSVPTISRKINRNNLNQSYQAETAQKSYETKRRPCSRPIRFTPKPGNIIKYYLKCYWSPEQVVDRLLQNQVCFKTIYRWINLSMTNFELILYLRQKGEKQKLKETRGKFDIGRPISQCPEEIKKCNTLGHWEADTVISNRGRSKGRIATFAERKSRYCYYILMLDRSSNFMKTVINNLIRHLSKGTVKTITVDREKEFSRHQNIENQFNTNVYFADPYSAWQRSTDENISGLLRGFSPKRTSLAKVNQEQLSYALDPINYWLRKCLDRKSPYEVLYDELLHLNWQANNC